MDSVNMHHMPQGHQTGGPKHNKPAKRPDNQTSNPPHHTVPVCANHMVIIDLCLNAKPCCYAHARNTDTIPYPPYNPPHRSLHTANNQP